MQKILSNNNPTTIILILILLLETSLNAQTTPQVKGNLTMSLLYKTQDVNNKTISKSVTVYNNSMLDPAFQLPYKFSCSDLQLFTLEEYSTQYYNHTPFTLSISNYMQDIQVDINTYYNAPAAIPATYTCPSPPDALCLISVTMDCTTTDGYNILMVSLSAGGQVQLTFQFNYICYMEKFKNYQPRPWGTLILAIFSIFMIFVCSKFQQAQSVGNVAFYINYPFIIIVNSLSIVRFVLMALRINNIQQIIYYMCLGGSVLLGLPAFMLCFAEGAYALNCRCLLRGVKCIFKLRVIDAVGLIFGVGVFCAWYFTYTNWIISDIIFIVIYVALIKLVKFGSLKIALASFAVTLLLGIVFIVLATKTSAEVNVYFFNNPLFLTAPLLAPIPNLRCTWYFLLDMAYPGMFLSYLERFDKNRSSFIYTPTFLICYAIFSVVWFFVGTSIKIPLPFDVFTVPISMALLFLFANRRGELQDLWQGRFFDEQKSYYQNQRQMKENFKFEKSASGITYDKDLFENLKYRKGTESSKSSNFSQIIKAVTNGREITELRHIYSQGQEKPKEQSKIQRDPLSNETQKMSKNPLSGEDSGRWTLSKNS